MIRNLVVIMCVCVYMYQKRLFSGDNFEVCFFFKEITIGSFYSVHSFVFTAHTHTHTLSLSFSVNFIFLL